MAVDADVGVGVGGVEAGMDEDDDEDDVRRVLAGERDAFARLVGRHERAVFTFLAGMLPHGADREDVAQEVFLAAYARLASFDPRRARLRTWLLAIARHRALDLLAAARRRRRVALDEPAASPAAPEASSPERSARDDELFARLDAALARLPATQRSAFVLAELSGLPYAEVARLEGVAIGTVKSRVARARATLRARLASVLEIPR